MNVSTSSLYSTYLHFYFLDRHIYIHTHVYIDLVTFKEHKTLKRTNFGHLAPPNKPDPISEHMLQDVLFMKHIL